MAAKTTTESPRRHRISRKIRARLLLDALEPRTLLSTSLLSPTTSGTAAAGGAGFYNLSATTLNFSPDGRFVLFLSTANNLVPGITDTNNANDLFLRDLQSNTTAIISADPAGHALGSFSFRYPTFSPDSRFLAFTTDAANIVPNITDSNTKFDLFLRDLTAGTTTLVTKSANAPTTGTGSVTAPPLFSPDGHSLVFVSQATDLIPNVTDTGGQDLFVRNMDTGALSLISINPAGTATGLNVSQNPVISPDGRYVAFTSGASNLVNGVTDTNGNDDLFVRDLQSQTTTLITRNLANQAVTIPTVGNIFSYQFTPDSASLLFTSAAPNMVADIADTNNATDLFRWTASSNAVSLLSLASTNDTTGNKGITPIALSPNGRFFAFASTSTNLTPESANGDVKADLYLRDLQNNTTTYIDANASTSTAYPLATFSPDNTHLLFVSSANNVIPALTDTNNKPDLFLYNLLTGEKSAITVNTAGTALGNASSFSIDDPIFSPDGRYLSFVSDATNIAPGTYTGLSRNLFVRDIQSNITSLVTPGIGGTDAGYDQAATLDAQFSPNSRFLLYTDAAAIATAITTPFNFNFQYNLYAFDLQSHQNTILSANAANTAPANGRVEPFSFAVNPAGGSVLFLSTATDMVPNITDINPNLPSAQDLFLTTLPTAGDPTPTAPHASLSGGGATIVSGDLLPSPTDGTNFGSTPVNTPISRTFTLANTGTAPLTTSNLSVPAGFTISEPLSPSIPAGSSDTFTIQFSATTAGPAGGAVTFTTNDTAATSFSFAIAATATAGNPNPTPQPDLVIEGGITAVKSGIFIGGTKGGKATAKLFNRGTAPATGNLAVSFYASADPLLDPNTDTLLITLSKKANIKSNKSLSYAASFTYPLGLPDGQYYILAAADSANAFTESNEANNTAASPAPITIHQPFIDLSALTLTPKGAYKTNKSATASLTLTNTGNVTATGKITLTLTLSTDDILGNEDDHLVLTLPNKSISIKPNKTTTLTLHPSLLNIPPGTYHLFATLDTTNTLPESNELNNTLLSPTLITIL